MNRRHFFDTPPSGEIRPIPGYNGKCGNAKLTPEKVLVIRQKLADGQRVTDVAREMGVHQTTISKMKSGVSGSTVDLQIHELASRAQAPGKWCDKRNFAIACQRCNFGPLNWLPESLMLAWKALHDPSLYDRQFVNELRHRATNAISASDVDLWLTILKRVRA